jgi:Mg-chelatase subunit ChlD
MWAFNIGLGGDKDYRELVRIRRLDARVSGTSQRVLLRRALEELPSLTFGGTGLYDTTLAAVRALRSDYDDEAINTVVLLTDGRNEDQHSIALPDLLHTLRRERDPARPVSVIAIGVGPDADAESLRRIVDATGGRAYVARDPGELGKVFQEALLSR